MITDFQLILGLSITIAFICIYYIWLIKDIDLESRIPLTLFITPMVSIFGGLIIMFGIRSIDGNKTISYKPTCNIISIKTNDVISGRFLLGSGSINQTEYYFYFYKTINGGYARGKKNVNITEIIEDDTQNPHIEVLTTTYESKTGWFKVGDETEENYKIIVPKGTILNKFELY